MTWRRRAGIVTAGGGRTRQITAFLDTHATLAVVESHDAAFESVHLTIATNAEGQVATLGKDGTIRGQAPIEAFSQELANVVNGEVTFGNESWIGEDVDSRRVDPFEQPLGADIAAFADRAVVFTRAPERGLASIAGQVEDVIHAVEHLDGHALCITEGPILTTLQWGDDTTPALIIEHGAAAPSFTVIPSGAEGHSEPLVLVWGAKQIHTPTPQATSSEAETLATGAFIDANLGMGALVRELMKVLPAAEPAAARQALADGMVPLLFAIGLPEELRGYLESRTEAAELPGAREIHPASFARSVRRVVTEASSSVSERAEVMRQRAVAARTRAETAFDAAEAFAEDVVLPVHQNWVSPALAVAEATLGVLALRKARRIGGVGGGALSAGGVLLLGDAVVNTLISLAPMMRRKS